MHLPKDADLLKELTVSAVVETLLDIGKPIYEIVLDKLKKEYNCYLDDCYWHPEYLNSVLKEVFGNAHSVIVGEIRKRLKELAYKEQTRIFIEVISQ